MKKSYYICLRRKFSLGIIASGLFFTGWEVAPLISRQLTKAYSESASASKPTKFREWRYLVIHHSGARSGNEKIIHEFHLKRGMENGMAYHFLIGNGSAGLGDGIIVEGHRWKHQLQGGHCNQDYLNKYGIGICLVADCNRSSPTPQQMKSLARLVYLLQAQFGIPNDRIHGHGDFFGEETTCPGRLFPWKNLWEEVEATHALHVSSNSVLHASIEE